MVTSAATAAGSGGGTVGGMGGGGGSCRRLLLLAAVGQGGAVRQGAAAAGEERERGRVFYPKLFLLNFKRYISLYIYREDSTRLDLQANLASRLYLNLNATVPTLPYVWVLFTLARLAHLGPHTSVALHCYNGP